ncbi:MAG: ornithine cyclodeaminase family protein [Alphaproteobacteria bacterium]|nr:ornithine cyclodeaminase family protein [Alphaproteobacteria bacterium]
MTDPRNILYLSRSDLEGLGISTDDSINAIEKMIWGRAEGKVWWTPKANILPPDGRYMMAALAASDEPPIMAVKSVLMAPENSGRGLPQINGLITVMDSVTGLPLACMDANWITAVRTAALSAVAAKRLARAGSSVAAFVGCGVQAHSHLDAFSSMYLLTEVRIFGRGQANIDALCAAAENKGLRAVICATGAEAIEAADLITTSVTFSASLDPFLDAGAMKPGSFAAITDLAAPWVKESFNILDRVIIDDMAQEASLPNKLADPDAVLGDISDLVMGDVAGRGADAERTAFIFRGHAIGDLAVSALAYQKALDGGLGVTVKA